MSLRGVLGPNLSLSRLRSDLAVVDGHEEWFCRVRQEDGEGLAFGVLDIDSDGIFRLVCAHVADYSTRSDLIALVAKRGEASRNDIGGGRAIASIGWPRGDHLDVAVGTDRRCVGEKPAARSELLLGELEYDREKRVEVLLGSRRCGVSPGCHAGHCTVLCPCLCGRTAADGASWWR